MWEGSQISLWQTAEGFLVEEKPANWRVGDEGTKDMGLHVVQNECWKVTIFVS